MPHVERAVLPEREATPGLVELHRGHADVEYDPVLRAEAGLGQDGVERAEAAGDQGKPAVGCGAGGAPAAIACGSRSIATTRSLRPLALRIAPGATAGSESGVDEYAAARGASSGAPCLQEHRDMWHGQGPGWRRSVGRRSRAVRGPDRTAHGRR